MMAMMKAVAQQQGSSPFNDDYRDACIASGAVGLWMLDETSGTVAVDQGTAGVDGTYLGDMATSSARGVRSAFNIPLAGVAAADSGTSGNGFLGGVIEVPADFAFTTELQVVNGAMSYEFVSVKDYNVTASQFWLKNYRGGITAYTGPLQYIKEDNDNNTSQTSWKYEHATQAGVIYPTYGSCAKQTPGVASHNVVTFDTGANYLRWYRNGVRIMNQYASYYSKINGSTAPIYIGNANNSSSYWPTYGAQGAMGGVAIYDFALSQTDVTTHYNALLT